MDVHVQEVITGKDMLPNSSGWSAHLPWLPTTCEVATNNYVHYALLSSSECTLECTLLCSQRGSPKDSEEADWSRS